MVKEVWTGGKVRSRPAEVLGMEISEMRVSKAKNKEERGLSKESNYRKPAGYITVLDRLP